MALPSKYRVSSATNFNDKLFSLLLALIGTPRIYNMLYLQLSDAQKIAIVFPTIENIKENQRHNFLHDLCSWNSLTSIKNMNAHLYTPVKNGFWNVIFDP